MFEGMITSAKAKTKKVENDKIGIYQFKLETVDMAYEDIAKISNNISATLLNIQPIPFQSIDFGEFNFDKTVLTLKAGDLENEFTEFQVVNISAKIKENISNIIFTIELSNAHPKEIIFDCVNQVIEFDLEV